MDLLETKSAEEKYSILVGDEQQRAIDEWKAAINAGVEKSEADSSTDISLLATGNKIKKNSNRGQKMESEEYGNLKVYNLKIYKENIRLNSL